MTTRVEIGDLSPAQVDQFARGLYHLAVVDGLDERETALIARFLEDAEVDRPVDAFADPPFDPMYAARMLDTKEIRMTFLRTGVQLLRADGQISDEEFDALRAIAMAFELKPVLLALIGEATGGGIF